MKRFQRIGLVIFAMVLGLTGDAPAQTASGSAQKIQSPPMTMDVPGALPASFRGGNADLGPVNILEDGNYSIQEHSVLYNDTPSQMGKSAEGSTFSGPPTINWTTEKENADGTTQNLGSVNNNQATVNSNTFKEPGTYRISNDGARQVSGGAQETSGSGSGTGASSGTGTGAGSSTDTGAQASQRVTSNQTQTIIAHDCTSPSLWAIFQEGAGSTDLAANEQTLKEELKAQMAESKGDFSPDSELKGSLKEASLLAMSEMPKNSPPEEKTAAVFLKGPLFDETGKKVSQACPAVKMTVLNQANQTRNAKVGPEQVKGVFIRRNIPFLATAQMTDNGIYNRDGASCRIIDLSTGQDVAKTDGAYMFRVANYPRDSYKDQPDYEFLVEGSDEAGNHSEIRIPIFVVNTQASFEGGKAE